MDSHESYQDAIQTFSPEVAIHLAWQGIPDYSFEISKVNLEQSLDLLSFVISLETCRQILVAGSCWELNQLKGACLETSNGTSKDDFTWAKHALRSWLEMECERKGIRMGWMRIFYAYGPRQRSVSLVPSILNSLEEGKSAQLRTPLNANDFVYVDDVAEAFSKAVSQNVPSGIYHLGSGISTQVLEVCRIADRLVNNSEVITRQLENETAGTVCTMNFWADCAQASNVLNWSPVTTLQTGIKQTYQCLKKR